MTFSVWFCFCFSHQVCKQNGNCFDFWFMRVRSGTIVDVVERNKLIWQQKKTEARNEKEKEKMRWQSKMKKKCGLTNGTVVSRMRYDSSSHCAHIWLYCKQRHRHRSHSVRFSYTVFLLPFFASSLLFLIFFLILLGECVSRERESFWFEWNC